MDSLSPHKMLRYYTLFEYKFRSLYKVSVRDRDGEATGEKALVKGSDLDKDGFEYIRILAPHRALADALFHASFEYTNNEDTKLESVQELKVDFVIDLWSH